MLFFWAGVPSLKIKNVKTQHLPRLKKPSRNMEVLEIISIHCFGRKRQKTVQCLEGDESEIQ